MSVNNQRGVSIIEVIIVTMIIGALAFLIVAISSSVSLVNKSRYSSIAKDIASRQADTLRKTGFINLANGKTNFTDIDLAKLASASAYYEITDCPVNICTQQEAMKQVKVVVNWYEYKSSRSAEIATLVGEGGVGQ